MPQVPKDMMEAVTGKSQGLLSDQPPSQRPDASSILMASAGMARMGRLGRGAGDTLAAPKKQKGTGKGMLR